MLMLLMLNGRCKEKIDRLRQTTVLGGSRWCKRGGEREV